MTRSAIDYRDHLVHLQPHSDYFGMQAFPTDANSNWVQLLLAIAEELARIDASAGALLDEVDPRTTTQLLDDWERVLDLPDDCFPAAQTTQERRNAIIAKLNALGGTTITYFEQLAAAAGFSNISITELGSNVWQVESNDVQCFEYTCISPCTDPLQICSNEQLQCFIDQLKPAHTRVTFLEP